MHNYDINSEHSKTNQFSPGPVDDTEELYRITLHPEHIKDGVILPTAISTEDLECRGYSVERKNFVQISLMRETAKVQIGKKPESRKFAEVAFFYCDYVRQLKLDDHRAFLVIDDAKEDDVAHASIYSAIKPAPKSILRKLRTILSPVLENRTSLDLGIT